MDIGIDIGGFETKVISKELDLKFYGEFFLKTPNFSNEGDFFSFVESIIEDKLNKISTINISIAGFYDHLEDSLIFSPNLNITINNLKEKLEKMFSKKVFIENDVNSAALYLLKSKKIKDFILLLIGTGLGCGIVSNGNLIRGYRGLGGEAGHMNYIKDGKQCGCGQKGCYESYCSGIAIERMKLEGLNEKEILEIMSWAILHLIKNLVVLLNPEIIFLGGGVLWHHKLFENISKEIKKEENSFFFSKIEKIKYDKFICAKGATFIKEFLNA